MMDERIMKPADLNQEDLVRFVVDTLHRAIFHHVQRFTEMEHKIGMEIAVPILKVARENGYKIQMNDCRGQLARNRRSLEDYPCKSAGLVKYRMFSKAIDDRIRTECVGCPPDTHPEEWFCAWRFTLPYDAKRNTWQEKDGASGTPFRNRNQNQRACSINEGRWLVRAS